MNIPRLNPEDQAALVALEESMWREQSRYDIAFQEQSFASDFFEFGRSGRIYTREEIVRMGASPIKAKLPLPNLRLRPLDVNTVQITYDSEATFEGVVEHAHCSSIWSRTPSGWVMRFHQGTPYEP